MIKMNLKEIVIDSLGKVKAKDVLVYDMKGFSPFFDEMVLATVDSLRQASAGVEYIKEEALKAGYRVRGTEGEDTEWVLIDLNDIIVSIFTKEERERVSIEKIYLDRPVERIEL